MRAKFINEKVNFQRGRGIKTSLDIGRKIIIELPYGEEIEGPLENEEKAKAILNNLESEIEKTREYYGSGKTTADEEVEIDEIHDRHMEEFKKIGFYYTEDWK